MTGGKEIDRELGNALPPLVTQMIEGRAVVTGLRDGQATGSTGIKVAPSLRRVEACNSRLRELANADRGPARSA